MIPYSRPKLYDLYILSQSKLLENHTLHSGHTYTAQIKNIIVCMYGSTPPYPPPPPIFAQHACTIIPKSSGNFSIREDTATGLSCSASTCTHFSFLSCHCQLISIMTLKGRCNKNRWCGVMWSDVMCGEGKGREASLTSTDSKKYPNGPKWEATLTNLWAPLLSVSRLLAAQDDAQNLEDREQLWTGVHQLMGSCFGWRGGRAWVLSLTDVWIAAIWSQKGRFLSECLNIFASGWSFHLPPYQNSTWKHPFLFGPVAGTSSFSRLLNHGNPLHK